MESNHEATTNAEARRALSAGARPFLSAARLAAATLLALPLAAAAQQHQARSGDHVLSASVVQSTMLNPSTARAHGIDPGPGRAVLDVAVRGKGGQGPAMEAETQATVRNLAGVERQVGLREARAANGWVSYAGTFDFAPAEVLDVQVHARPKDGSPELDLAWRERMPAR